MQTIPLPSFERVVTTHPLAALDLGVGVEQPVDCLQEPSGSPIQTEVDRLAMEDNVVGGLFFCSTHTGRRRGHTRFA